MDLHPTVIHVEHVRASHRHLVTHRRRWQVGTRADAVCVPATSVGRDRKRRRFPGSAAWLVGGDDLGDEIAVLVGAVAVVEQALFCRWKREVDVDVAVVFVADPGHGARHRDAGLDDLEPVRVVHVGERRAVPTLSGGGRERYRGLRLLGRWHTGWRGRRRLRSRCRLLARLEGLVVCCCRCLGECRCGCRCLRERTRGRSAHCRVVFSVVGSRCRDGSDESEEKYQCRRDCKDPRPPPTRLSGEVRWWGTRHVRWPRALRAHMK